MFASLLNFTNCKDSPTKPIVTSLGDRFLVIFAHHVVAGSRSIQIMPSNFTLDIPKDDNAQQIHPSARNDTLEASFLFPRIAV